MRRILIAAAATLGLLGVAAGLGYLLFDVNQLRPAIQDGLQKQLHRPVTLGAMSLGLFPLAVRVDDLVVGENPAFPTGRPFLTAKQIRVRAELLPLLSKKIQIESLVLTQPAVELVQNVAGQWNYADLVNQPSSGSNSQPLALALLQLEDGALALTDMAHPASRSVYEHVNVELADFAPGKKFTLKAAAQLPGGKSDSFRFEGTGGASAATPFQGRLTLTDAPLAGLARFSGSALPVDGQLTGTADIQNSTAGAAGDVNLELKNAAAQGKPLGFPVHLTAKLQQDTATNVSRLTGSVQAGKVPVSISGELNNKASSLQAAVRIHEASLTEVLGLARLLGVGDIAGTGVVSLDVDERGPLDGTLALSGTGALRDAELQVPGFSKPVRVTSAALKFDRNTAAITQLTAGLASSNLRGTASVTSFASPRIAFDFDVDKVDVEELTKATSPGPAQATTSQTAATPKGKAAATSPPLYAKGNLHVGTLSSQGLTLTDVRSDSTFDHGVLTLSPLSAKLFGGTQTGTLRADTVHQPMAVELNLKLLSVDANQLLSSVTSVKNTLYGNLGAAGNLHMLIGAPDLARTLNGTLSLSLAKGRLAGTSILNELSTIGKFAGLNLSGPNVTNITQLGGDINIVNGVATTNNLQLVMEGGSLSAAGTAGLADQTLNMKITAVLDKAVSQRAGGVNIGGYLTTALANSKGELVIPANVTGTFAQPHFAPDAARLAEMKLKNILPAVSGAGSSPGLLTNPKGSARSVLDALSGKQAPSSDPAAGKTATPPDAPAQQSPAKSVQGVIDLFRKKK